MKLSQEKVITVYVLLQKRHARALSATEEQVKETRGQNTIFGYPNEIQDRISQNNIPPDPASRNSNIRDKF